MGGGTRDNRHYDEASLYGRHDCWIRWRGKNTITVRSACRKGRLKSEESMRMTKGEDEAPGSLEFLLESERAESATANSSFVCMQ